MTLPEKDHPIWKILAAAVSIGGLVVWLFFDGTHNKDVADSAGVIGGAGTGMIVMKIIDKLWS